MKPDFANIAPEDLIDFMTLHAAADLVMSTSVKSTTKRYRNYFKKRAVAQGVVNSASQLLTDCLGRNWREHPKPARERMATLALDAAVDMMESGSSMTDSLQKLISLASLNR